MTSEEYTRKLYEKMYAEQQAFREWLHAEQPQLTDEQIDEKVQAFKRLLK